MSTTRPFPTTGGASAILAAAARAAVSPLPDMGAASATRAVTTPPAAKAMPPSSPMPPRGATGRNAAQQIRAFGKTNPPRAAGVTPRQMMAARLLLSGYAVAQVAAELGVHRYTVSRWKRDPLFDAELRRQLDRAAPRNTAQQNPARTKPPAQNEANSAVRRPGGSAPDR